MNRQDSAGEQGTQSMHFEIKITYLFIGFAYVFKF